MPNASAAAAPFKRSASALSMPFRHDRADAVQRGERHRQARERGERREQQRFDRQQREQPLRRGAERRANRHLAARAPAPRASIRFAMFTHAISSTIAVAPSNSVSGARATLRIAALAARAGLEHECFRAKLPRAFAR